MSPDVVDQDTFQPGDLVPLSWQQRVIWYQAMLDPDSTRYHCHALFHFDCPPDLGALNRALRRLAGRHRVLLTRLAYRDGDPHQVYPDPADADALAVREVLLAGSPSTKAELVAQAGANRAFDLQAGPLFRWTLARLPEGEATLIHTEHHLVHDGMSFMTLVESLSADNDDTEVDDSYFQYASHQPVGPHPAAAAIAKRFAPAATHRLPRQERGPDSDPALRLPVPTSLVTTARAKAKADGVSLFTVLFTAFAESVHRSYGPVVLGTAVANRPPGHEHTVGMFVSTVPMTIPDEARMSPQAVAAAINAAVQRSDVPITDVVSALPTDCAERHGLVSVGFSLHEQGFDGRVSVAGVAAELTAGISPGAAKFPVNVVLLVENGVTLLIDGQAHHVDRDQLWALWTGFVACLRELCDSTAELPESSLTPTDVIAAVRRIAEENGTQVALRDETTAVSYADLVALGDDARWCTGTVVGLLGGASARFFAAAYAVLHGGGTYVPLDAQQPPERLLYMVRQAGCEVVVDLDGSTVHDAFDNVPCLSWEQFRTPDSPIVDRAPTGIAYIMFTSGSTGAPKGVRVRRAALARLCDWAVATLEPCRGTVVSQVANVGFDASVWEVWPALYAGAELVVTPNQVRGDPAQLKKWLQDQRVEVAFAPTPVAEMLMDLPWPESSPLRILGAGGDQLHLPGKALPFRVINLYGPTECTVAAAAHWVDPRDTTPPPIGTAPPYCSVAVVAEDGCPVPAGQIGELWLGGGGVADGYAAAAELTAPRFVPDPHSFDGAIVYRTGDLVRQDPDGVLTFCGRRDRQVKVSGVRIELAEVEATVLRQADVQHAVAVIGTGERGFRQLSVVVVPRPGADEPALANRIRASLSPYLRHLPIRLVPELPLNSNGKVNQTMLSAVKNTTPPAQSAALALAESVLGVDELDQSWFSAGGSSMDAARLITRLNSELGVTATVRDLLEAPSVRSYLSGLTEAAPIPAVVQPAPASQPHPIDRTVGERPPAPTAPLLSPVDVLWPSISKLAPNDKLRLASMLVGAATTDIWPG